MALQTIVWNGWLQNVAQINGFFREKTAHRAKNTRVNRENVRRCEFTIQWNWNDDVLVDKIVVIVLFALGAAVVVVTGPNNQSKTTRKTKMKLVATGSLCSLTA